MKNADAPSLDHLLSVWQASHASGREIPPPELCREHPALLGELERRIAVLKHIGALAPVPPLEEMVTLSVDDTTVAPKEPYGTVIQHGPPVIPESLREQLKSSAGPKIDGYRPIRLLGAGGMGEVWEAEDTTLHRSVALKVMLPGLLSSAKARDRFLREARSQASIHHEHVAVIHAVGESDGTLYIVMPLLKGETLAARLRRSPELEYGEILRIGREIAEGLAAAHDNDLIHRDIKPANIWLEGNAARVRLLDFGLARVANRDSDGLITASGVVLGTPAYMAPEQAAADDDVDGRADLFSLGVVLYEMSTGQRPFAGKSTFSVLNALATFQPPAPCEVSEAIPTALSDAIQGLLVKDPAHRQPQSARECVTLFRMLEAGETPSVAFHRARPSQPSTPASNGFWLRAAVAIAVVLVLATALAYQVRHLVFEDADAVKQIIGTPEPTKPEPPDPNKLAVAKLEGLLPRFRKQPLVNDCQLKDGNGVLGIKKEHYHNFKGNTGAASLKEVEKNKFLLTIEYGGDHERKTYDLGILQSRENNTILGRIELAIQIKDGQFQIGHMDHISYDPKAPTDHMSHQCAKKAIEQLLQEVLPGSR